MINLKLTQDMRKIREKYDHEEGVAGYRHDDPDVIEIERKHGKRIEDLEKEAGPIYGES